MVPTYSLRSRLTKFALVVVASTMVLTGIGLAWLFQRHIEQRVGQELTAHLEQIIGDLRFNADGSVELSRALSDPRFGKVLGGLYFQVTTEEGQVLLKSRSLWDQELDLPRDALAMGMVHIHHRPGPNGSDLLVHESRVLFADVGPAPTLRISVAIDTKEIHVLRAGFTDNLVPLLGVLGAVLLAGFAFQIGLGLRPMNALRDQVAAVRSGQANRMEGVVPREVQPLVHEVNSLLDLQDQNMVRARDRAADLAHGLKTPLTALASDVARLRARGEDKIADEIQQISTQMLRHLDRELARSRFHHALLKSSVGAREAVDAILRTLAKTPDGERLTFHNQVPDGLVLAIDQVDFLEIAGNLLENAGKYAAKEVSVSASVKDGIASVLFEDDGPGIPEDRLPTIMQRGQRLDSQAQGSGLGLAITKDILEAYGGYLSLKNRETGGLSACITLPSA